MTCAIAEPCLGTNDTPCVDACRATVGSVMASAGLLATTVSSLKCQAVTKQALGPETSAVSVKATDSVLTIPLLLMVPLRQCAFGIVDAIRP